jgi:hypothetical protein
MLLFFRKFVNKIIMFQKALRFQYAIVFYYNKQIVVKIIGLVPPLIIFP